MSSPHQGVVVWNVRGINCSAKRNVIIGVIRDSGTQLVCLQETKVQNITTPMVRECLGNTFDSFFALPAIGSRGGILIVCKSGRFKLSNTHLTNNTLTTWVLLGDTAG